MEDLPPDKAKNGRPTAYCEEIATKVIDAIRSGLTLERAAEYVGMNPSTVQNWTTKRPSFGRAVKKARRDHEISLLRSIELAGEKSWQARAWILERAHGYAVPSSRLSVDTNITHNAGQGFAQLIAGLASRRAEKKAQAQIVDIDSDIKQIKNNSTNYSESIICKDKTSKNNHNLLTNQQGLYNNYCATNEANNNSQVVNNQQNNFQSKTRHVRMKRRKPRQKAMDTTTPTADPPAAISTRNTPLSNSDTKQKEDYAQEATQGSAEVS